MWGLQQDVICATGGESALEGHLTPPGGKEGRGCHKEEVTLKVSPKGK